MSTPTATAMPVKATEAPHQNPRFAEKGIPAGAVIEKQRYCGPISIVIGCLVFPCICCCPCDEREVYTEPTTGRRVNI